MTRFQPLGCFPRNTIPTPPYPTLPYLGNRDTSLVLPDQTIVPPGSSQVTLWSRLCPANAGVMSWPGKLVTPRLFRPCLLYVHQRIFWLHRHRKPSPDKYRQRNISCMATQLVPESDHKGSSRDDQFLISPHHCHSTISSVHRTDL